MSRPRLREKPNPFHALLVEAAHAQQELREYESPEDRLAHKATFEEMLRVALRVARRERKWAVEQHQAILNGGPDTEVLRGSIWRFAREYLSSSNWTGDIRHPNRLGFYLTDAARTECSRLRLTVGDLYCCSIIECQRRWPDSFGPVEDLEAHRAQGQELRERAAELCRRVGEEWQQSDLQIGDMDKSGRAHLSFRVSGGAVAAAPQDTAGERLVNWLLTNPRSLRELEEST